ncbi:conserved hypothetical protein [Trichinella spiralis]|nr:conserved hypothetical protein [Trichinella spiralis]
MPDDSELQLVINRYGGLSLVYEGRAYKLKRTCKATKYWLCSKDKQGCKAVIWTNLEVTTVINQNDHIETCPVDQHLAYKMEKKAILKKRSAEETTPIPTIYEQEASAASADPSTAGQFPVFKRVKATINNGYIQYTGEHISANHNEELLTNEHLEMKTNLTTQPCFGMSFRNGCRPLKETSIAIADGSCLIHEQARSRPIHGSECSYINFSVLLYDKKVSLNSEDVSWSFFST